MTVPDLDRRIEAAASKIGEFVNASADECRCDAEEILLAAFPELFDGSAWLAPWKASEFMAHRGEAYSDFVLPDGLDNSKTSRVREMASAFASMRDAHLAKTEGGE